jgi:hypothetical protein
MWQVAQRSVGPREVAVPCETASLYDHDAVPAAGCRGRLQPRRHRNGLVRPDAEVNLNFRVNAVDSKGQVVGTSTSPPVLTEILPGQRLGVGSYITLSPHSGSVARLEASVIDAQPVPVADFSSLPTPTVTRLTTGARDRDGLRQLSFDVTTTPAGTMLCARTTPSSAMIPTTASSTASPS